MPQVPSPLEILCGGASCLTIPRTGIRARITSDCYYFSWSDWPIAFWFLLTARYLPIRSNHCFSFSLRLSLRPCFCSRRT